MITLLNFHDHQVRVVHVAGEPQWVATDVAAILGFSAASALTRYLDADERGVCLIHTPSGAQEMTTITEPGLYSAIMRSRKPEAKEFKRWVTREVLPSIRRHGGYLMDPKIEEILTDPDTIIKLATDLKQERARRLELEQPARSWEQLADAAGDYSVATAAKVLSRDPSIKIGRDRLFAEMASAGWVFRSKARRGPWEASQKKAVDTGRLAHKLGRPFFNDRTEEWEQPAPTIRVTTKGLLDLHRLLGGADQIALFNVPQEVQ